MAHRIVTAEKADSAPYHDPFGQQWWNLMQVLAWVYLGMRGVVRDAGLPANKRGYFFQKCALPDGRLENVKTALGPFTVTSLRVKQADCSGACYPSFSLAEKAVIEALQASRLTAYGLQNGAGDLKEIPSLLWADLKFWYEPNFAGPRMSSGTALPVGMTCDFSAMRY
jgi:hypothetical protein